MAKKQKPPSLANGGSHLDLDSTNVETRLHSDYTTIENLIQWLEFLWADGIGYFWYVNPDDSKITQWVNGNLEKWLTEWAKNIPDQAHCYFGINPTAKATDNFHRANKKNPAILSRVLFAEFDYKTPEDLPDIPKIKAKFEELKNSEYPPSVIVFSGAGLHCYWLLEEIIDLTQRWGEFEHIQYSWVDIQGSDQDAKDLHRVLRIPLSYNLKPGYNKPRVEIWKYDLDQTYNLNSLIEAHNIPPYTPSEVVTEDYDEELPPLEKIERHLSKISLDHWDSYSDWLRIGFALHSYGEAGLYVWRKWSKQSKKYKPGDCEKKWATFGNEPPSNPVTIGTIIHWATTDNKEDYHLEGAYNWQWITGEDLLTMPNPPTFLVANLIVQGSLNLLYGEDGVGKTLFAMDLAVNVSNGSNFLEDIHFNTGGYGTNKTHVLWYDYDNGRDLTIERLQAFFKTREIEDINLEMLSFPAEAFIGNVPEAVDAMIGKIQASNAGLLVLDNLSVISGGIDENSPQMQEIMSGLKRIIVETGCTIILLHNTGKNGERERGHSRIRQNCDLSIQMSEDGQSKWLKYLRIFKARRYRPEEFSAKWTFDNDYNNMLIQARFVGISISPPDINNTSRQLMITVIRDNPGLNKTSIVNTAREIADNQEPKAEILGVVNLKKELDKMKDEGLVYTEKGERNAICYYATEAE